MSPPRPKRTPSAPESTFTSDGRVRLTFRVDEGRRLAISGVRINGNSKLSDGEIVRTRTTVWTAGVKPHPVVANLGLLGYFKYGKKGEGKWITLYIRKGHVFMTVAGFW